MCVCEGFLGFVCACKIVRVCGYEYVCGYVCVFVQVCVLACM